MDASPDPSLWCWLWPVWIHFPKVNPLTHLDYWHRCYISLPALHSTRTNWWQRYQVPLSSLHCLQTSCLYVPLLPVQNNIVILANVAGRAQWKRFLQRQHCDDQLPHQDSFMGHLEDEVEQGFSLSEITAWESVASDKADLMKVLIWIFKCLFQQSI